MAAYQTKERLITLQKQVFGAHFLCNFRSTLSTFISLTQSSSHKGLLFHGFESVANQCTAGIRS